MALVETDDGDGCVAGGHTRGNDGKDQRSFAFAQAFGRRSDSAQPCCLSEPERTDGTKSTSWGHWFEPSTAHLGNPASPGVFVSRGSVGASLLGPLGERERVVVGGESVCACDIEGESHAESFIRDLDPHPIGRLAPEKPDGQAIAFADCELLPFAHIDSRLMRCLLVGIGGGHRVLLVARKHLMQLAARTQPRHQADTLNLTPRLRRRCTYGICTSSTSITAVRWAT